MPLSRDAREVLEAAVELNPGGARDLLAILRTAPGAVKYKPEDELGPLGLMVKAIRDSAGVSPKFRRFRRPDLPTRYALQASRFRQEWLSGGFSKSELADALEGRLQALGVELPDYSGRWLAIRPADG